MNETVVIISMIHWHFTWQIQQNLARGLAERGHPVLFVEPLPKRWPRPGEYRRLWGRLTGHSEAAGICHQPLVNGVELVSPRLLPDADPLSRAINRRWFVPGIARKLSAKASRPLVVINYLPTSASLALMRALQPDASFYHCVNDWDHDPYAPPHFIEAELARSVDMVWADSPVNLERTQKLSSHVVSVAGGVDFDLFARAQKEPGPAAERPLCAYFGMIGVSTDIALLRAVSQRYRLRLVGPVRADLTGFSRDTEIVGAVPQAELPDLLRDADVLLLPYAPSDHNDSVLPAKLFECLATGKPVVAYGLRSLDDYADLIYVCDSHQAFLEAIAAAGNEPRERRSARIACARANSYARLFDRVEEYFRQARQQKESREASPAA